MISNARLAWAVAGLSITMLAALVGWMIQPLVDDQIADYLQFKRNNP